MHAFMESSTDPEATRSMFFVEADAAPPPDELDSIISSLAQPPTSIPNNTITPNMLADRSAMVQSPNLCYAQLIFTKAILLPTLEKNKVRISSLRPTARRGIVPGTVLSAAFTDVILSGLRQHGLCRREAIIFSLVCKNEPSGETTSAQGVYKKLYPANGHQERKG